MGLLPLGNDAKVYTLSFANDQVVVAQVVDDLEDIIQKLIEKYDKWALKANIINKMEYLCMGGEQQDLRLTLGQIVKNYNSYKYLRVKIAKRLITCRMVLKGESRKE